MSRRTSNEVILLVNCSQSAGTPAMLVRLSASAGVSPHCMGLWNADRGGPKESRVARPVDFMTNVHGAHFAPARTAEAFSVDCTRTDTFRRHARRPRDPEVA